jgi:metal-responsive CopG/Arc/MetJ family transcriptional regulator
VIHLPETQRSARNQNDVWISLRAPRDLVARADRIADLNGISRSDVVRLALYDFLIPEQA